MILFHHRKFGNPDALPLLIPVLVLNPLKEEAYILFELKDADWPLHIRASKGEEIHSLRFYPMNNADHLKMLEALHPLIEEEFKFEMVLGDRKTALWGNEEELKILNTVMKDYIRLLE